MTYQVVRREEPASQERRDDEFLLAVLNSTPIVDGATIDVLADPESAHAWLLAAGGLGTATELRHLRRARAVLQGIARGETEPAQLGGLLRGVSYVPDFHDRLTWVLRVAPERVLAVRAILGFEAVLRQGSGRIRPCANHECALFLIDRSPANRARWCSMAVCGNRMKARRHYRRTRESGSGPVGADEPDVRRRGQ